MTEITPSPLNNVITIDDERIKNHLDRVVRGSVEETLNALLEAEADRLCNAQRYERNEARRDTRAGHYERKLQTKAGEVRLKVPKLRMQTFETAIIERYRRREPLRIKISRIRFAQVERSSYFSRCPLVKVTTNPHTCFRHRGLSATLASAAPRLWPVPALFPI